MLYEVIMLIQHVMRRNVETVQDNLRYNDLLQVIAHSRYDRLPVVDKEGRFIGIINYAEIRDLLFEPDLAPLVVASDLTVITSYSIHYTKLYDWSWPSISTATRRTSISIG